MTTVLAGAAVASVAGIIYAYALYWIPFVYLNFLFALGFAGVIGAVVAVMALRGKIRNNLFVGIMAVLVTLLGMYVYWAAYAWAVAGIGNVGIRAFWPPVLASFGKHLFENGSWGIKNLTVTGWPLVAVWVIEACTILWISVSIALTHAQRPFCESCNEWTQVQQDVVRLAATGDEPVWQKVFAGDLPALAEFQPAEREAKQFVRLDLARCPHCEQSRFLTVSSVKITIDKKEKENVKERRLVTNAIVTPGQFAVVETCAKLYAGELQPPQATPAEEPTSELEPRAPDA
jgi:hypothetical protein